MDKKEYRTIGKYKILTLSLMLVLSISVISAIGSTMYITDLKEDIYFLERRYTGVSFPRRNPVYFDNGTVTMIMRYYNIQTLEVTYYFNNETMGVPYRTETIIIKEE